MTREKKTMRDPAEYFIAGACAGLGVYAGIRFGQRAFGNLKLHVNLCHCHEHAQQLGAEFTEPNASAPPRCNRPNCQRCNPTRNDTRNDTQTATQPPRADSTATSTERGAEPPGTSL